MIQQPMAFCWDDRGRLWVAENLDYETRGRGFSNAGNSRILILEDTDRDGVADSRKVFMEGIVFPSALAVGFDGVFVGAPPNLLFVPDRDGDDKADMADIEVRLTGWGIRDRHEVLNSLHWGPDGWLYGLQGFATPSKIRKPAGRGPSLQAPANRFPKTSSRATGIDINGGVWRYHPTKDRFEVVAHGFSNPWGIDYDAKGQLLISACVIPHLWHVVPGGIYHRQGGQHFNPYVYSDIQTIADHRHRSAHGGARVYQSDAFPGLAAGPRLHGQHPRARGAVGRARAQGLRLHRASRRRLPAGQQRAVDRVQRRDRPRRRALRARLARRRHLRRRCPAPGDRPHLPDRAHRSRSPTDWPGRYADLRTMTDAELVDAADQPQRLARPPGARHPAGSRREGHARRHDTRRAPADVRDRHQPRLAAARDVGAARHRRLDAGRARSQALVDRDEHIRAWAIQLLCEDGTPSPKAVELFERMARDDRSAVVRLYLAAALQRLDHAARWTIASALLTHAEDAADQNLPTMIWLGVEPLVAGNPALALERAGSGSIPLVARYVARRTVDADALEPLVAAVGKPAEDAREPARRAARRARGPRRPRASRHLGSDVSTRLKRSPDSRGRAARGAKWRNSSATPSRRAGT